MIREAGQLVSSSSDSRLVLDKLAMIEIFTKKIDEAQKEYATALDGSASASSTQEMTDYEQYSVMAEATLEAAYEAMGRLQ
ncbi:unnamed protein product, partial [Nippostrongylus brasiliensis]|uniref:14_3_3 domain-containing protein n=1 Tax=Nippostrongylus brasiliensis TaxID=27835 RepID=A0A0N4YU15_NIPBR